MDFALGYELIGERITIKITMKDRKGSHSRPFGPSFIRHGIRRFPLFTRVLKTAGKIKGVGWMVVSLGYRQRKSPLQSSLESQVWLI